MNDDTHHRLLVLALREPTPAHLPADFAVRIAERAAVADATPFERFLLFVLPGALGLIGAAVTIRFGDQWMLGARASGWLLAFAGCAAASCLIDQAHRALTDSRRRAGRARP